VLEMSPTSRVCLLAEGRRCSWHSRHKLLISASTCAAAEREVWIQAVVDLQGTLASDAENRADVTPGPTY